MAAEKFGVAADEFGVAAEEFDVVAADEFGVVAAVLWRKATKGQGCKGEPPRGAMARTSANRLATLLREQQYSDNLG